MDFQEKLDRAKTGSHAAYESLCLGSLDKLYCAALIALKSAGEAKNAVVSAVTDGYSGISRIKDERHLRSWLAHELTKNIVDRLKQLRSGGVMNKATGAFEASEKLADVERLIFALSASFGYNARELSILTGMSADTVSGKLASAKARLGSSYSDMCRAAASVTAPAELKERYSSFDEALARLEQSEKAKSAPVQTVPEAPAQPVQVQPVPVEEAPAGDVPERTIEIDLLSPEEKSEIGEEVFSDPEEEAVFEAPEPEEITDEEGEIPGNMLNAAAFISVVSAERMKGSEFLRLIGNTRISNSAYREIEQNPHLTKKRLIELLEQSPLKENDYYKLFTALKDRRDVLSAKEENRIALEKAGLYDGSRRERNKRRRREKPQTELQMAIGISEKKPVQPLTFDDGKESQDDLDYQLQNHTGTFKAPGYYRDHLVNNTPDKTSLEAVVTDTEEEFTGNDPLSHTSLHDLFDEHNDEPIDPLAAIAAKETGDQVKPGRIDEQRDEWQNRHEEHLTDSEDEEHTGVTKEFEAIDEASLELDSIQEEDIPEDARSFAGAGFTVTYPAGDDEEDEGKLPDEAITEQEETAAVTSEEDDHSEPDIPEKAVTAPAAEKASAGFDPFAVYNIDEDRKDEMLIPADEEMSAGYDPFAGHGAAEEREAGSAAPIHDSNSVTQIISAYPDKPQDAGPDLSRGYRPDTGLIFDAASDSLGDEDESLEFSFDDTDVIDTVPISIGDLTDRDDRGEKENIPYHVRTYNEKSVGAPLERELGYRTDYAGNPIGYAAPAVKAAAPAAKKETAASKAPAVKPEPVETKAPAAMNKDTGTVGYRPAAMIPDPDDEADIGEEEKPAPDIRVPEDDIGTTGAAYDEDAYDEAPARERYKGNEYFIDDDEYYEGVNRGKIITCAVLAVLLAAGSAGMKLLPVSGEPGGNEPAAVQAVVTEDTQSSGETPPEAETEAAADEPAEEAPEASLVKLASYDDFTSDKYKGSLRDEEPFGSDGYLRASAEPLDTAVVRDISGAAVIPADGTVYIYSKTSGTLRAVTLSQEEETEEEIDTDTDDNVEEEPLPDKISVPEGAIHAFTSVDGDLYMISDKLIDDTHYNKFETQVTVYASDLSRKAEYTLGGDYAGAVLNDGKLTVAVSFRTDKAAPLMSDGLLAAKHPYYTENGELHEIPASDIYAIDGAKHNAVHILYTIGGNAAGVLGGYADGMNSPESITAVENGIRLIAVDDGVTYSVEITDKLVPESVEAYRGEAFGTVCIGSGGMIGMNSSGCMTAYKGGKLITVPNGVAQSAAWSESGIAYVVSETSDGQKMLYGFDMSGEQPEGASINASDIYTDKLIRAGKYLAGLKAEPSPDGERAGLRLSLYEYDGELKETAYSIIELDKDTPRENLRYLSSPAEQDIALLAVDESGTMFAVPTVYFDGYSEVERVIVLNYDGSMFTQTSEHIAYDEKSSVLCPVIYDGKVYVITDTKTEEITLPADNSEE